ncbi:TolC family outer membrane protein [Novosphingobium sp. Gsoil 351]|uniref:TolC family outer membrane protein n=1 Tax=Novosphingobium sp. Gsoil 351 TaxID=2675225 RepID=UPI0012B47E4E|nr:TolC family outer membrane protein [Novosphingobium sp. Gsoil 351]QGN54871.1 TolC family outer membrane protein [Novosphingobium sp. Gsoil 351]
MRRTILKTALLAGVALSAAPALANPDTLQEALVSTYQNNPTLLGARAQQRAVDEGVPIARADGLPSVNATAQYVEFLKQSSNNFTAPARQVGANVDLSVPIYSGGAVKNGIRAAKTRVEAGQADLRGTEASVFSQAVGAYMDVLRDQAIVGLSANNVKVLEVNLKAASDRFEIGDLTRTDVAQSNSRLALARGDYRTAQANLISSRERYIQIVGKPPVDLQPPPPLPGFPASVEDAEDVALANNPDLVAAKERSKAAGYDIDVAGAGRLPKLSVFSGGAYTNYLNTLGGSAGAGVSFAQTATTAQAGVRATIPIFQGGRPAAQERRAQAQAAQTYENEIAVERDVIAQVRSAWSSYQAATAIIATNQVAVDAAALSLEGVRAENTVGNRTILNILDAEQELLRAQVQLVTARRNAYVAGFTLLAAMGRAEADDLGLDAGPLYDPEVNYRRVKGKIWDWAHDPDPKAQATRTVDTLPQDASIPPQ